MYFGALAPTPLPGIVVTRSHFWASLGIVLLRVSPNSHGLLYGLLHKGAKLTR